MGYIEILIISTGMILTGCVIVAGYILKWKWVINPPERLLGFRIEPIYFMKNSKYSRYIPEYMLLLGIGLGIIGFAFLFIGIHIFCEEAYLGM